MLSFFNTNKYITNDHIKYYLILVFILSIYVFYYRYMKLYQNNPKYIKKKYSKKEVEAFQDTNIEEYDIQEEEYDIQEEEYDIQEEEEDKEVVGLKTKLDRLNYKKKEKFTSEAEKKSNFITDILSYIFDTILDVCLNQFDLTKYLSNYIELDRLLNNSKNIKSLGVICIIFSIIIYFINLTN